jgi:hypothetical protein
LQFSVISFFPVLFKKDAYQYHKIPHSTSRRYIMTVLCNKLVFNFSRRENILLTVGEAERNLRTERAQLSCKPRKGRHFLPVCSVVPAGLGYGIVCVGCRRLKPTVNKVSPLRGFAQLDYIAIQPKKNNLLKRFISVVTNFFH